MENLTSDFHKLVMIRATTRLDRAADEFLNNFYAITLPKICEEAGMPYNPGPWYTNDDGEKIELDFSNHIFNVDGDILKYL